MTHLRKTIEIKAQPQRIFDYVNHPMNLPGIWPSLVEVSNVTSRPNGAYDFDWVYKMAGIHLKGHANNEESQPGRLSRTRNEGGIPSTFVWTFQGLDGNGTKVTVDIEYTVPTPVVGKLAEAIVVKINEHEIETLLANLREVCESMSTSTMPSVQARR